MVDVPLSELFHIKGRFRRSVHLERDFYTENVLDGYILTVTAREMLSRVISTLENDGMSKAWSLTGPYGSGKSAFALYAAKLLGNTETPTTQQALELLKDGDASLYQRFSSTNGNGKLTSTGFCPVLISGERSPLALALLRGLSRALTTSNGNHVSSSLQQEVTDLLETAENDSSLSVSDVTHLYELATLQVCENGGSGLLLIIDEFGKFLEYASQNPSEADIFVLQSLAELADRSRETPLFLMTILHQAFEAYAQRSAKTQREEWAKIQGRFEDVVFAESTEQVIRLVSAAIDKTSGIDYSDNVKTALDLELKPSQLSDNDFIKLLQECLPLHPTVALLIGPLFRRFAQNERSLFAFLSSSEPYGLQEFLSDQHYDGDFLPLYSLDNLYDYLDATQGTDLYTSANSKKWAEIETAILQFSDPSEMTIRLIKAIGLLGIFREAIPNLKATEQVLKFALDDGSDGFNAAFDDALNILKKRSIITYRRYNNIYAIWEGSDIDIETRLRDAHTHIDARVDLAGDLSRYTQTRPLVARRHLFQTGTLRFFSIRYTDFENFDKDIQESLDDADGLILYALPTDKIEVKHFIEKAINIESNVSKNVLIVIPQNIGYLKDSVTQLAQLHWVVENTPELAGDKVAKRELDSYIMEVEREVSDQLSVIFRSFKKDTCFWYYNGERVDINSEKTRNEFLSKICDEKYPKTPIIRNEIINRRKISGAATTARKRLIEAMLENGDKKDLSIKGYPPQKSIYQSLLLDSGIHRQVSGVWGFYPPEAEDKNRIEHTWSAIETFLDKSEDSRQPIENLYEYLKQSPIGIRNGPLPILLCAVILHYKTEIALYENGSFVADLSLPLFERLLKAPQQFELKRFRLAGIRAEMFSQFLEMLNQPVEPDNTDLLTIVTPLMRFVAQLPNYTLKTQELSDAAKSLRQVVRNASEPDELLFRQLPESLGFTHFTADATDSQMVADFFNTLQAVLSELSQTYEKLLNSLELMLAEAFNLDMAAEELRQELVKRAEPILEVVIETQLKGFLIQICSGGHDLKSWIEAIASFLAKKPPASWLDTDKAQFEVNLSQLVRKFHHFESVSYDKWKHIAAADETMRIGVTTPNEPDHERVVNIPGTDVMNSDEIEQEILRIFNEYELEENTDMKLAILGRITKRLMQEYDQE